jgi:hypothetical protein
MDSITQSIWQGFEMAHSVEQDKRLAEAAKMQAAVHQQQMLMQQMQMMEALQKYQQNQALYPGQQDKQKLEITDLLEKAKEAAQKRQAAAALMQQSQDVTVPSGEGVNDLSPERPQTSPVVQAAQAPYSPAQHPLIKAAMQAGNFKDIEGLLQKQSTARTPNTTGVDANGNPIRVPDIPGVIPYIAPKNEPRTPNVTGVDANGNPTRVPDVPGVTPYVKPQTPTDEEAKDLAKEQKRSILVDRILKRKFGVLPSLNSLTGETVFPTNPATNKPFTTQEWAKENESEIGRAHV